MAFEFDWPWMGLLFAVPPLVRWFWPARAAAGTDASPDEAIRQQTLLHPALHHLASGFGARPHQVAARGPWHGRLSWLLWAALVLTMMRPQWLEPLTETRIEGYDLMLAIDASHSMEAMDFTVEGRQVTRMAVLKGVVDRFIADRTSDRIGLIVFGNHAYTVAPLTYDLDAVRQQLDSVGPNVAGTGTAMGDAIGLGVLKLRDRPKGSRVLILVADGGNSDGTIPPLEAARMAAQEQIRVYAIGVGTDSTAVQIFEGGQVVTRDDLALDDTLLRTIAELSGGAFFRATDANSLEEIYRRIATLEKTRAESRTVLVPHSLHVATLLPAAVFALLLGMFPDGRIRLPRNLGARAPRLGLPSFGRRRHG